MMNLVSFALRRPISLLTIVVGGALAGFLALDRMSQRQLGFCDRRPTAGRDCPARHEQVTESGPRMRSILALLAY
jgi:hypothetical protein